jgi:hypothetical protein
MGSFGRPAKEPVEHAPTVTAERRVECGDPAGAVLGEQRRRHRDGVQRYEQHNWLLPRKARHDEQRNGRRIKWSDFQEHEGTTANGNQRRNLRECGRRLGSKSTPRKLGLWASTNKPQLTRKVFFEPASS